MSEKIQVAAKKPEVKRENLASKSRNADQSQSMSSPADQVLYLQRTIGNQAVQRLIKSGTLQAKLRIGQPGDKYEQEADRVADAVIRMPEPWVQRQVEPEEELLQTKPLAEQITPLIQRQVEPEEEEEEIQGKFENSINLQRQEDIPEEEEEEPIQTKGNNPSIAVVTPGAESNINSLRGGGQPFPKSDRYYFESRFGYDFSQVRVHTNSKVAETAKSMNANAFTNGTPLPASQRQFFENRFGQDFSQVRIHTDPKSAAFTQDLEARAFTLGKHIGFGHGEYAPQTHEGQKLLAHELGHVIQQQSNRYPVEAQLKSKKAKKKKFYQHVLDEMAVLKKGIIQLYSSKVYPIHYDYWEALLKVCEAVEKQEKSKIPKLLKTFMQMEADAASEAIALDRNLTNQLATRLFFMGMEKESQAIHEFYLKKEKKWAFGGRRYNIYFEKDIFWEKLTDEALAKIDLGDEAKTKKTLDLLLNVLGALQKEKKKITAQQLKEDAAFQSRIYDPYFSVFRDKSISDYYGDLSGHIKRLVAGLQKGLQQLTEQAVAALESGKGLASLTPLETYLKALDQKLKLDERTLELRLEITRSDFKKRRHLDIFLEGKAAKKRRLSITFYDITQKEGEEKQLLVYRLRQIRYNQLKVLKELYGPKHSAAVSKIKGGKLRLRNLDDWREFLYLKYQEFLSRPGGTKEKAIEQVIKLLQRYLKAFTISTPYNISDIGGESVNYLKRLYPRALTGQIIQDCGVFALRNAYLLSLLREKLNLDFRFVMMPNHISLVITSDDLPLIIVHNNSFLFHTAAEMTKIRAEWQKHKGPKGEEQFLGELAGGTFYGRFLDFPFRVFDVPPNAKTLEKYKKQLWGFYKKITPKTLFGRVGKWSDVYQFHLKYLETVEAFKHFHNYNLWPFWHIHAPKVWKNFVKEMEKFKVAGALAALHADSTQKHKIMHAREGARLAYFEQLKKLYQGVRDTFNTWEREHLEITELYRQHPKLKVKGARVAVGERVARVIAYPVLMKIEKYLKDAPHYTLRELLSVLKRPPFEKKANKFEMID